MLLYLDTNAYISAKYQFSQKNLAKLKDMTSKGEVILLCSSLTKGEVQKHIREDVKKAVMDHNRRVGKDMIPLTALGKYSIIEIPEKEAIDTVLDAFDDFLEEAEYISLNTIDTEELVKDYFEQRPPFEAKKPCEFKDAIVIKAIKAFQKLKGEKICIVSSDEGFRKAFEGEGEFIAVKYLTNAFQLHYHNKDIIEAAENFIISDEVNRILLNYFSKYEVDRGNYCEWELNDKEIIELESTLLYAEQTENGYLMHLSVDVYLDVDITHRDEDTSFYDRGERRYLIENYLRWNESHRVTTEISMECNTKKEEESLKFEKISVVKELKNLVFYLDEDTMISYAELESDCREESGIIHCSECGRVLGLSADYFDYKDNPLCDKCIYTNDNGEYCPKCGKKYPFGSMLGGFCEGCSEEFD